MGIVFFAAGWHICLFVRNGMETVPFCACTFFRKMRVMLTLLFVKSPVEIRHKTQPVQTQTMIAFGYMVFKFLDIRSKRVSPKTLPSAGNILGKAICAHWHKNLPVFRASFSIAKCLVIGSSFFMICSGSACRYVVVAGPLEGSELSKFWRLSAFCRKLF